MDVAAVEAGPTALRFTIAEPARQFSGSSTPASGVGGI